jgi:hypothetical protein
LPISVPSVNNKLWMTNSVFCCTGGGISPLPKKLQEYLWYHFRRWRGYRGRSGLYNRLLNPVDEKSRDKKSIKSILIIKCFYTMIILMQVLKSRIDYPEGDGYFFVFPFVTFRTVRFRKPQMIPWVME